VYVLKDIRTSTDEEVSTIFIVLNFCGLCEFSSWGKRSLQIKHTKRRYAILIHRLLIFYSRTSTRHFVILFPGGLVSNTPPPVTPNPPSSPSPQTAATVGTSMAMVNMNNLLNGKDSRWLQLEVCREFQRNKCTRPDTECKFAHPPANVEVQNGRVTACYDSIKVRKDFWHVTRVHWNIMLTRWTG